MLQVKDLMSGAVDAVAPDARLHDVLSAMNRAGYRHLPVVANDTLVGIITDRDVRLAVNSPVVDKDTNPIREDILDGVRVDECMTRDPQCVSSDMAACEVADLLALNKFGAMPVVDDGRLVGMISTVDYLKHYAANG